MYRWFNLVNEAFSDEESQGPISEDEDDLRPEIMISPCHVECRNIYKVSSIICNPNGSCLGFWCKYLACGLHLLHFLSAAAQFVCPVHPAEVIFHGSLGIIVPGTVWLIHMGRILNGGPLRSGSNVIC